MSIAARIGRFFCFPWATCFVMHVRVYVTNVLKSGLLMNAFLLLQYHSYYLVIGSHYRIEYCIVSLYGAL